MLGPLGCLCWVPWRRFAHPDPLVRVATLAVYWSKELGLLGMGEAKRMKREEETMASELAAARAELGHMLVEFEKELQEARSFIAQ